MGFVRKTTGIDLTGGGASDAASEAAALQVAGQRQGLEAIRQDLGPFRQVGEEAANLLLSSVFEPTQQDPSAVLQNPFFQALARQQEQDTLAQRAALGLAGSGGTQDALTRNLLQLGWGFQQQDISNALQQNQLRFNQLMGITGIGQASAAQTGAAGQQALTNIGQIQGVPGMVEAQVKAQQGQQLMSGLGALAGGAVGGPFGAMMGGNILGGGSAVAPPVFSGGAGMGRFGTGSIGF